METTPKAPIKYRFHCTICGGEFRPTKKHARTCGTACRVALSNIMRYSIDVIDDKMLAPTKEETKQAEELTKIAKGEPQENVIDYLGLAPNAKSQVEPPSPQTGIPLTAVPTPPPASETKVAPPYQKKKR